jgi:hypothetical protein
MRLEVNRQEGLRNDLLLRLERAEIETAQLSVAHRDRLMALPGIPRHRAATAAEEDGLAGAKWPIADHLRHLGIVDRTGVAQKRAIAISNRNLGANHGHLAWQRDASPKILRVLEDPCDAVSYSCLTVDSDGVVAIEDLRFDCEGQRISRQGNGRDVSDVIEWATSGQRVLRDGVVSPIEEIAHHFYDIRHVLAFDGHSKDGGRIRDAIYQQYPQEFRRRVHRAWAELGVPRSRYFHNAIGVSSEAVFIVQREGTIEEIGEALKAAGARDGLILDNGGSVVCWAWWANQYAGATISTTIDYRPPGTSAIAFVLKGPLRPHLPGGSVSYSVA